MADEPSQEQLLEQQKANCIFCKIIKGEIPSKKVYEDERIIAILDINPAVKGHCLVMTKEHYPIMPLMPPEEFDHLFGTTARLSGWVSGGMLTPRCTTFIANGAIAGQQSPHFLFHLIPREEGDALENFSIPKNGVNQSDIAEMMKANLYSVMRQHLTKTKNLQLLQIGEAIKAAAPKEMPQETEPQEAMAEMSQGAKPPEAAPQQVSEKRPEKVIAPAQPSQSRLTTDQLAQVIETNPDIKALLINNPEKMKQIIDQNPQFKEVFAGVNINKLGEQLRQQYFAQHPNATKARTEAGDDENSDITPAKELTLQQIFSFIDSKPHLREYILHDPEELRQVIPQNERLQKFFEGSNVNAIIQAYQEHAKAEQEVHVTIEPDEEPSPAPVKNSKGPGREESEDAWDEVRGRHDLNKISRLFR